MLNQLRFPIFSLYDRKSLMRERILESGIHTLAIAKYDPSSYRKEIDLPSPKQVTHILLNKSP